MSRGRPVRPGLGQVDGPGSGPRLRLFGLVLAAALLAACGGAGGTGTPRTWSLVALGDSVPYGTNCDCRPYPLLTADALTATPDREVTATNDAVAGYTTGDVLRQVQSDADVTKHLSAADAIEIEVGANDVGQSRACGTSLDCYTPDIPQMEQNLSAVVADVHELTAGHPVLVVLLDYWSLWLGGTYAESQGEAYVTTAAELTDDVNTAIRSVAAATGSAYVDLRAAFKGPDYTYDETHYLSDDGDHPNEDGHQKIAAAAVDVIEATLKI
ncbi:MAG: SGNH/GDSL hydrolase family protein [Kineosporiaceae bacterium]